MLGVSIASFSFIIFSSLFKMPISGTHTVVGALIGAGIAGVGFAGIAWKKLVKVIASWFVSPVLASAMCGLLFVFCVTTTLGGYVQSTKTRMIWLTIIGGISVSFMTVMCINIATASNRNPKDYYAAIPAFAFGVFATRFVLVWTGSKMSRYTMEAAEILI